MVDVVELARRGKLDKIEKELINIDILTEDIPGIDLLLSEIYVHLKRGRIKEAETKLGHVRSRMANNPKVIAKLGKIDKHLKELKKLL
ncbi:MAG: hypothetical protein KAT77_03205 [Nanoarchaeota archaeon]|nr:hypothetical protein [Nanoarchaeota archaeon]